MTCALTSSTPVAAAAFRQLRQALFALTAVLTVAFSASTAQAQCLGTITTGNVERCSGSNVTLVAPAPGQLPGPGSGHGRCTGQ
jgi:hypothetical protein